MRGCGPQRRAAGTKHAVENLSDQPFEVILVELKVKPAAAKPARLSSRLTLLVFKDNSISAVTNYWLEDGQLHYTTSGDDETAVPLERIDLEMTARFNWERGVKFVLRPKAYRHPNSPPRPGEAPHPAPSARKSATQTAQKTALCAPWEHSGGFGIRKSASNSGHSPLRGSG